MLLARATEQGECEGNQVLRNGLKPAHFGEGKHESVSDIDTVVVESLKALDPHRPIREADITMRGRHFGSRPKVDISARGLFVTRARTALVRRH
jgi:hypothetical protein